MLLYSVLQGADDFPELIDLPVESLVVLFVDADDALLSLYVAVDEPHCFRLLGVVGMMRLQKTDTSSGPFMDSLFQRIRQTLVTANLFQVGLFNDLAKATPILEEL